MALNLPNRSPHTAEVGIYRDRPLRYHELFGSFILKLPFASAESGQRVILAQLRERIGRVQGGLGVGFFGTFDRLHHGFQHQPDCHQ